MMYRAKLLAARTVLSAGMALTLTACAGGGSQSLTSPTPVSADGLAAHPSGVEQLPNPTVTVNVSVCGQVTLSWSNLPTASGHTALTWHVQINDSTDLAIFNAANYTSTTLTQPLAPGTYTARVSAKTTTARVQNSGFVTVQFTVAACSAQACSPGFWRQEHHFENWPNPPAPSDLFNSVFSRVITVDQPGTVPDITDPTLQQATQATGDGVNRIARIGTAAYLSAVHPAVNYPFTAAQVIAAVQHAIDLSPFSGPSIDDLENVWKDNPDHCPLGNDAN
jgi:hypothetical protein